MYGRAGGDGQLGAVGGELDAEDGLGSVLPTHVSSRVLTLHVSPPTWWTPNTSLVLESMTTHFPVTVPTTTTSPSQEKAADWTWLLLALVSTIVSTS